MKLKKVFSLAVAICLVATSFTFPVQAQEISTEEVTEATPVDAVPDEAKVSKEKFLNETPSDSDVTTSDEGTPEEKESDDTESEEIISGATGFIATEEDMYVPAVENYSEFELNGAEALPESYMSTISLVKAKYPSTRDQGSYGTCTIHSVIAGAELSMIRQGLADKSVDYSEAQLAYFTKMGDGFYGSAYSDVIDTLSRFTGAVTEADVPYSTLNTDKEHTNIDEVYKQSKDVAVLESFDRVSISKNPEIVKQLIEANGAVLCSIYAANTTSQIAVEDTAEAATVQVDELQDYYNKAHNAYYSYGENTADHAVAIVGWNDNFSKSNFNKEPETDGAWLIRNSWTTNTQESYSSYFWLSYCDKGLGDAVYSLNMRSATEEDENCYVCEIDDVDCINYENKLYICKLNPESEFISENLEGIFIKSSATNEDYKAYLYALDDEQDDLSVFSSDSTEKELIASGSFTCAGGKHINLSNPVNIDKAKFYYLVIESVGSAVEGVGAFFSENKLSECDYYNIIFNGNGADNSTAMHSVIETKYQTDVTVTLPKNAFTKNGYTFAGWNTRADGSGTSYEDEQSVTNLAKAGKAVVLYAMWKENVNTLSFDANGGTGTMDTIEYKSGTNECLPKCTFTREGYVFIGWSSTKSPSNLDGVYRDESTINNVFYDISTLYAIWVEESSLFTIEGTTLTKYNSPSNKYSKVVIPEGITTIASGAFANPISNLNEVVLPSTLTTIEAEAFASTSTSSGYLTVDWNDNVKTIGERAFQNTKLAKENDEYVFPDSIESIGDNAFDGCFDKSPAYIPHIYFGPNVTSVGEKIFGDSIKAVICSYSGDKIAESATNCGYTWSCIVTLKFYGEETLSAEPTLKRGCADMISIPKSSEILDSDGGKVSYWMAKLADGSGTIKFYAGSTIYDTNSIAKSSYNHTEDLSSLINKTDNSITFYPEYTSKLSACCFSNRSFIDYYKDISVTRNEKYGDALTTATSEMTAAGAKLGLRFEGWYLDADCTEGNKVDADTICKKRNNFSLYANWSMMTATAPTSNFETGASLGVMDKITLTSPDSFAPEIYYTIDGSDPVLPITEDGATRKYTKPFTVYKDATVKAIAVGVHCENSKIASFTYTSDAQGQIEDSDMPEEIPSGIWIAGINEDGYTYTGSAIKLDDSIRVYWENVLLINGTDYKLTYKNNVNVGTKARITVNCKGYYSGSASFYFTINPTDISTAQVQNIQIKYKYNGRVQKPKNVISYTLSGKTATLKEGRDYTLVGEGSLKETGNYVINVVGKGNYTGKTYFVETIGPDSITNISKIKCTLKSKYEYSGSVIEPVVATATGDATLITSGKTPVALSGISRTDYDALVAGFYDSPSLSAAMKLATSLSGYDYIYEYAGDTTNIGKVSVKFIGINKYNGTMTKTYSITGNKLSGFKMTSLEATYNGDEIDIAGTIVISNKAKTVLKCCTASDPTTDKTSDYVLTYSKADHTSAGSIVVTAKGINSYSGTLKATFKIKPYVKKAAVTDEMTDFTITGFDTATFLKKGATPTGTITFNGKNAVTLVAGKDYKISVGNNKAVASKDAVNKKGKSIAPNFTIVGLGNFKGSVFTGKFDITKADFSTCTLAASNASSTGKCTIKSKVTVKDVAGTTLKEKTDYTLKYTYTTETTVIDSKGKAKSVAAGDEVAAGDKFDVSKNAKLVVNVTATPTGGFEGETESTTYTVFNSNYDISKATVTVETKSYNGIKFEITADDVTVKIAKKAVINADSEKYKVISYKLTSTKGGTATIEGCGDYIGTKTVTFKVKSLPAVVK